MGSSPLRQIVKVSIVTGTNELATTTYDGPGAAGLPYQQCQPPIPGHTLCKTFNYDNDARPIKITYSDPSSTTRTYTYDPAGHKLTATNGDGTQTFWYDLEGRVVNSKEPNQGTSPATYTHEFYADGKLKQLDVASNALTRNNGLYAYQYTTTGQLATTSVTYTPQNVNVMASFQYTSAGRLQTRSETGSGADSSPTVMSYDNYGQLSSVTYPNQSPISSYQYDPEGDLLSFGVQNSGPYQTFAYTIRGDLLPPASTGNPLIGNPGSFALANGAQVQTASGIGILDFSSTWDDRMGVMTAFSTNTNPTTYPQTQTNFTYDAAGRERASASSYCSDSGCDVNVMSGSGRSYDVDNHTINTTQSWTRIANNSNQSANVSVYDWGPSDHPIRIGSADSTTSTPPLDSAATYDTLHWDGDQLIFETNSQGNVDDIKVGTSGDITPLDKNYQGITFWDRGPGGAVVYCHNSTGSGGTGQVAQFPGFETWGGSPCSNLNQTGSFPTSIEWYNAPLAVGNASGQPRVGGVGQGSVVGMYRPDGISDGANTIQGVRTTDTLSGTWTTPDAFAGIVGDPKSQKSYVWNGNNPITYSDPSGYAINGSANCSCAPGEWVAASECSENGCAIQPDDGGNQLEININGSSADVQRITSMLNQVVGAIQSLEDDDRNSLLKALGGFLTSSGSNSFTIDVDDAEVSVVLGADGYATQARIADFNPYDPRTITIHLGSVDAIRPDQRDIALEQGLVNDIGTAATLAGQIGNIGQQYEARMDRNDDYGTNDDVYIDDFANHWLLEPLGLPDDI